MLLPSNAAYVGVDLTEVVYRNRVAPGSLTKVMNQQRILPLVFTLTFALLLPLLTLNGPMAKPPAPSARVSTFLRRIDRNATDTWSKWHEKNEKYADLVRLDQR